MTSNEYAIMTGLLEGIDFQLRCLDEVLVGDRALDHLDEATLRDGLGNIGAHALDTLRRLGIHCPAVTHKTTPIPATTAHVKEMLGRWLAESVGDE
jgi:hypothetical protein